MKEYIVITPSNLKKKVIELSRKKYYNYNIKFMSINEFVLPARLSAEEQGRTTESSTTSLSFQRRSDEDR